MPIKQVTLGSFVLHGEDRAGQWITEGLEGWYEPPVSKGDTYEYANSHGELFMPEHYGTRTPTIDGILFHKNRGLAVEAFERLAAAVKLTQQKLVITDAGLTRWANARYAGLDYTQVTPVAWRFQVRLKCVDPFKYGATAPVELASGAPGYVHHMGTVEAWPVVTVTGNAPGGYTLTLRGKSVSVPSGVLPGETHRVDFKTRHLYIDGEILFGLFGSSDFVPVLPGPRQAMSLTTPTGSATATVSVTDTFI